MFARRCDVSNEDDVTKLFKFVRDKFTTLHVMVNNAGLAHNAPLLTGDVKVTVIVYNEDFILKQIYIYIYIYIHKTTKYNSVFLYSANSCFRVLIN